MLCALMYRQNGDLANLLKSARKKGVRCNRYLANAQIEVPLIGMGLPLPFDQSCEMSVLFTQCLAGAFRYTPSDGCLCSLLVGAEGSHSRS